MLLNDEELRVEGDLGVVLLAVADTVAALLEQAGHTIGEADGLVLRLLPRLHARLGAVGCVVRQIDQPGRHARDWDGL